LDQDALSNTRVALDEDDLSAVSASPEDGAKLGQLCLPPNEDLPIRCRLSAQMKASLLGEGQLTERNRSPRG
jgi:hypothetical protein